MIVLPPAATDWDVSVRLFEPEVPQFHALIV